MVVVQPVPAAPRPLRQPGAREQWLAAGDDRCAAARDTTLPAVACVRGCRERARPIRLYSARRRLRGVLGRGRQPSRLVQALGHACWSGTRPGPSGSWAASSTPPTTAWTATRKTRRRNKAAIIWEGEPGDTRRLTYADLYREVNRFAAVLLDLGVEEGRPRRHLHADDSRAGHRACWPARASARRTSSSSAASAPRRCATASSTPGQARASPPMAAGGAATSCRSRTSPTPPSSECAHHRARAGRAARRPRRARA